MAFYIWQEEVEELRANIHMAKEILESKRERGLDTGSILEDIAQWEKEIVVITERNTNSDWF